MLIAWARKICLQGSPRWRNENRGKERLGHVAQLLPVRRIARLTGLWEAKEGSTMTIAHHLGIRMGTVALAVLIALPMILVATMAWSDETIRRGSPKTKIPSGPIVPAPITTVQPLTAHECDNLGGQIERDDTCPQILGSCIDKKGDDIKCGRRCRTDKGSSCITD